LSRGGNSKPTAKIRVIPNGSIKKRGTTGSKDAAPGIFLWAFSPVFDENPLPEKSLPNR